MDESLVWAFANIERIGTVAILVVVVALFVSGRLVPRPFYDQAWGRFDELLIIVKDIREELYRRGGRR